MLLNPLRLGVGSFCESSSLHIFFYESMSFESDGDKGYGAGSGLPSAMTVYRTLATGTRGVQHWNKGTDNKHFSP